MALKKNAGSAQKKEQPKQESSFEIEVTRAKDVGTAIMFDMKVNGVMIYGCSYKTLRRKDNNEEFAKIGFPSRQGSDGNWYNNVYFKITDEMIDTIEKGLDALL